MKSGYKQKRKINAFWNNLLPEIFEQINLMFRYRVIFRLQNFHWSLVSISDTK